MFIIIFKYFIVSIVVSLIFGVVVLSDSIIKKRFKKNLIGPYLFQLWSLILFVAIWTYYKAEISVLNMNNLLNWNYLLLLLMSIVPTSIIVYQNNNIKPNHQFKLKHFLNGASMEIPQRLLIQNLFVILGINIVIYGPLSLSILLNATIWVQFIMVQEIISGNKITKALLPEIIASFWFSIWIGILYNEMGNIIIPMLAHGLQRYATYMMKMRYGKVGKVNN